MQNFQETGLKEEIIQAISELGFETPTPIQAKTIPQILTSGQDLIALAQTGTGKTAAFGLPIIHKTSVDTTKTQTLILCPTRELCMQITNDIINYSKFLEYVHVVPLFGGANIAGQIKGLRRGCQIVVGTPGRLLDLIKRKNLVLKDVEYVILDEADEMLTMGFKDELDGILSETPDTKQTLLFSATMPPDVRSISRKYMSNAEEIKVGNANQGAENIAHHFYMVNARDRYEALKRVADLYPSIFGIVFCRTRKETKEIADKLILDGYNADALHGDLSQMQRDIVMNRFRTKHLQILVATDVAARGLDVNDLSHIINYNLPDEMESYIHRSGRTGRAGKSGTSISIIHSRERGKIKILEKKVGKKFDHKQVPNGIEVCEKQLFHMVDKIENVEINNEQIEQFLPTVYKKLNWLSREELIQRFVSVEFNRFLSYYEGSRDLNVKARDDRDDRGRGDRGDRGDRGSRGRRPDFARFYISVGEKNRLTAPRLMGLVNEYMNSKDARFGKIEVMGKFSFFELDSSYSDELLSSFADADFDGEKVVVEPVKHQPRNNRGSGGGDRYRGDRGGDRGGRRNDRRDFSSRDDRGGRRDDRGGRDRDDRGGRDRDDRGGRDRDDRGGRDRDDRGDRRRKY